MMEILLDSPIQAKISGATNIGIPNRPAEVGTRGLLKAHDPKKMKLGSPNRMSIWKIELY
jgi:hypothetical protein